jgi:hypothetical protein
MPWSAAIDQVIARGLFDRLPATFATYTYDRLREWDLLFPAEQNYFERLLAMLDRSEPSAVGRVFSPLGAVETKMGVDRKTWNAKSFTLAHVDFLQRSPYYAEWRRAISAVFAEIDPLLDAELGRKGRPRLVIVTSPSELPASPDRMWTRIASRGRRISLKIPETLDVRRYLPLLLCGGAQCNAGTPSQMRPYTSWHVSAGGAFPRMQPAEVHLAYEDLASYREALMAAVRNLLKEKQIAGPQQLGSELRNLKVAPPAGEIGRDPLLASFLRSVLLAGNGTLLINNTFAEWAAVQAIRRARPERLVVSFSVRNKLKPFSSLLIYSDQVTTNPVETQMDTLGTHVDLEVFYQYIWQECEKYVEYRNNTAYLFAGEGMDELLAIGPPDFPLLNMKSQLDLAAVHAASKEWLGI